METIFNLDLITHNILSIISIVIFIGLAIFTYLNDKRQMANITMSLVFLGGAIFSASHVIGSNLIDPELSKYVYMFNLCMFFVGALQIHAVLCLINKNKEYRWFIYVVYGLAGLFTIFFLIFPDFFLLASEPKMYFPNYYNPGIFNISRIIFMDSLVLYAVYLLFSAYKSSTQTLIKGQFKYFAITLIVAYTIIGIPNLLVYNIQINPSWGMLSSMLFVIPFLYGSVKYELFNVRIIAKQAFVFSLLVVAIGGLITTFNYSNAWIQATYPTFPIWLTPLISAMMAVVVGVFVWKHLRDSDLLKYEFITTVTHKFRTPLTHIKWAAENLSKESLNDNQKIQVEYIESANGKLVELTNVLMNISGAENDEYQYRMEDNDLSEIIDQTLSSLADQLLVRKINLVKNIHQDVKILCDSSRIRFVMQTLIENAVHYSPEGGTITISVTGDEDCITCVVKDSGIGIPKEELDLLFSKFYRGRQAKLADTEGMGIGLFMSKEIIDKHKGKIWVESQGQGMGSSFIFTLPKNKN